MLFLKWLDCDDLDYVKEPIQRVRERARFIRSVLIPYAGKMIDFSDYRHIRSKIREKFPDGHVYFVYRNELRQLTGSAWTKQQLTMIACCLAGGYQRAKEGLEACGILSSIWPVEDAVCRVDSVDPVESARNELFYRFHLVVCNSRYAGQRIVADIQRKRLKAWTFRFNLRSRRYKLYASDPRLFHGCLTIGRLEGLESGLTLHGVVCDTPQQKFNQELLLRRHRSARDCPFDADFDCLDCEVGTNECSVAWNTQATSFFDTKGKTDATQRYDSTVVREQ